MRIGVTGHQKRDGICWSWVRSEIRAVLLGRPVLQGYSSLAAGTDQIFAEEVLSVGGSLYTVVPTVDYESCFDKSALQKYLDLKTQSKVINLRSNLRSELAFLEAGRWIARKCNLLVAVWDGEPADGLGGTADIVSYAKELGRPIIRLDPIDRSTIRLG